jgi:poly-gamma-glutamate synthesis protein (capsule biosynthesis protein)
MAFVGDTHGYNIVAFDSPVRKDMLSGVDDVLQETDVFVFNHEAALVGAKEEAERCGPVVGQSTFAVPASFAEGIGRDGLVVAGMANNHALDCGSDGLAQTVAAFARAGIATVGAGLDRQEACRPLEVEVLGLRLAFLAYFLPGSELTRERVVAAGPDGPGVATIDRCDARTVLRDVRERADFVVVLLHVHVGNSWSSQPAPDHVAAVRQLRQWGADLVVADGPHFPQGLLAEDDWLALLSMGNFMFRPDYLMPLQAHRSFIALVDVQDGRLIRTRLYPIEIRADGLPALVGQQESLEILEQLDELSRVYGTTVSVDDGVGIVDARRP